MNGYEKLAEAIIVQAANDYRGALKELKAINEKEAEQRKLAEMTAAEKIAVMEDIVELESFFHSNWFDVLTNLDGEELMLALQKEAENDG